MRHALGGGLWLHRHTFGGEPMAHLVSSDRGLLLEAGHRLGMRVEWLQYKPLKDPETGVRVEAWHWDLRGISLRRALELAAPTAASVGEWGLETIPPESAAADGAAGDTLLKR